MKILIVGQGKSKFMAAAISRFKELYPDAEIVTQESLMNQLPADSAPQKALVFFDEVSEMYDPAPDPSDQRKSRKNPYMGNHPWSRRKKR